MNPLRWRILTWVLLVLSGLVLVLLVTVASRGAENCEQRAAGSLARSACEAVATAGMGLGLTAAFGLWFTGFVVLSLIWLMTRRPGRLCPVCGHEASKGQTRCASCGFDFAAAASGSGVHASPPRAATP